MMPAKLEVLVRLAVALAMALRLGAVVAVIILLTRAANVGAGHRGLLAIAAHAG
jgi:hypothetical protein